MSLVMRLETAVYEAAGIKGGGSKFSVLIISEVDTGGIAHPIRQATSFVATVVFVLFIAEHAGWMERLAHLQASQI